MEWVGEHLYETNIHVGVSIVLGLLHFYLLKFCFCVTLKGFCVNFWISALWFMFSLPKNSHTPYPHMLVRIEYDTVHIGEFLRRSWFMLKVRFYTLIYLY